MDINNDIDMSDLGSDNSVVEYELKVIRNEDDELNFCDYCREDIDVGDGIILNSCMHLLCRNCILAQYEKSEEEENVRCPLSNRTISSEQKFACTGYILNFEIQDVLSEKNNNGLTSDTDDESAGINNVVNGVDDLKEEDSNKLPSGASNAQYSTLNKSEILINDHPPIPLLKCANPNCHGFFSKETPRPNIKSKICPLCNVRNCIACNRIHPGQTCEEHLRRLTKKMLISEHPEGRAGVPGCKIGRPKKTTKLKPLPPRSEQELKKDTEEWGKKWDYLSSALNNGQHSQDESNSSQVPDENEASSCPAEEMSKDELEVLTKMEESRVIVPNEEFECPICYVDVPVGNGVILGECFHRFCRGCLKQVIEDSTNTAINCPHADDDGKSCEAVITEREMRELCSEEALSWFHNRVADQGFKRYDCYEFRCKNPAQCDYWCEARRDCKKFICPLCNILNCVPCKACHEGTECKAYRKSIKYLKVCDSRSAARVKFLIRKGKAMECPRCKHIIEKNGGCDGITCFSCRLEICWATKQARWGPKGRGDTSGGCRCRDRETNGGRPCHPRCGNCH